MVDLEFLEFVARGPLGWLAAGLWGAIWGSFCNVLIVRAPGRESLMRPASHCRSCRAPIRWYDNIPLLSYVILRGHCRGCGARIPVRYLAVELLVTSLALLMYQLFVVAEPVAVVPLGLRLSRFIITSLFAALLAGIAFIDLATMRIPDVITYPGIPVCAGLSLFMGHGEWWDGPVGAISGYLLIRLVADGYQLLTGRAGMGYGDAKLLALIGGLLGWRVLLPVLFLAAFQGTVIGCGLMMIFRRSEGDAPEAVGEEESQADQDDQRPKQARPQQEKQAEPHGSWRYAQIPFGPFLSLSAVEILLWGDYLLVFWPFLAPG